MVEFSKDKCNAGRNNHLQEHKMGLTMWYF